jgi:methionyl-tRNA synthetase
MAEERLMVISPAPTANGDLHLGHLAGPFLASDVCRRYAQAAGQDAMFGTGMHFTQNYVVTAARRLGVEPEDLRAKSAAQVEETLAEMGIEVDGFACVGDRFVKMVLGFHERLHSLGKLKLRAVKFPYSPKTGEYLMDAYVRGGCPFCLADGNSGFCESCGHPIDPGELIDPHSASDPDDPIELREVEILVFQPEEYRAELEEYFAQRRASMRPHMAQLVEEMFSGPLPEYPITHPSSWGIPAPFPEVAGQVIYAHMEGMPWSMFTTALAAEHRGAVLTADDELWQSGSGTKVVYFLGLDATYPFAVVGTAMLMALGDYVLPEQFITNDFYELANDKFSTSRDHLVSGRELAAEVPRDLIRFHLASTSPEFQRTDFTREALARVTESRLVGPWNRVAAKADAWVGRALPVSERSRAAAQRVVERFAGAYGVRRFSMTAAAFAVAEQLARLDSWQVTSDNAGDFCHEVDILLRCAAPILVDLSGEALRDNTIPAQPDATEFTLEKALPRLASAGR